MGARVQDAINTTKEFGSFSTGLKAYHHLDVMYAKHMRSEVRLCDFEYQLGQ